MASNQNENNLIVSLIQYPVYWTDEWVQIAIKELNTRQMDDPDHLLAYKMILINNIQAVENVKAEVKQAVEEATQQVTQQVTQQEKIKSITKSIQRGKLSDEEIAEDNDVTIEFVQKTRKELN